jgi:hypothetical protein
VLRRQLVGSRFAHQVAQILREADAALGSPAPERKPTHYMELAEAVLGQLDPLLLRVAEHHGAERVYEAFAETAIGPSLTFAQKSHAMFLAFEHGIRVYHMVLEGRLANDEIANAQRAVREGR